MIKSALFALLVSAMCCYGTPSNYYSYFPSKDYYPAPPLYNFKAYETSQYQHNINYSDGCAQSDNQIHLDAKKYYQINFENGPFLLSRIEVKSQPGTNQYVTKYKLQGSLNNKDWFDINGGLDYAALKSDKDASSFDFLYEPSASNLRFYPSEYFGCLRFSLILSYNDNKNTGQPLLQERNRIFINSYKLPENQTVTPASASVPKDYDLYQADLFNNVYYYGNKSDVVAANSPPGSIYRCSSSYGKEAYGILEDNNILGEILGYFFDHYLLNDPIFRVGFKHTDPAVHKKLVVEFFSQMLGGKLKYTGKSMEEAHRGMGIFDLEFTRFLNLISKAFATFNVNENVIQEVICRLETYRKEVVNK
jgi:hemoglobin